MNADEAQVIATELVGNWPQIGRDPHMLGEWRRRLEAVEYELASDAVDVLMETEHHPPSRKQWRDVLRLVERQRAARAPALPAPDEGPVVPATEPAQRIRKMLAAVDAATNRASHDHSDGPENCPTCGLHDRDAHGRHKLSCARCRHLGDRANQS